MPRWDDRIDEAARRLTEGAPSAGFRSRVGAKLDKRPRRWSRAWLLAPVAATAIVIIAVVMPREAITDVALKPETSAAAKTDVGLRADATPAGLKAGTTPAPAGLKTGATPVADVAAPVELIPI